MQIKPHYREGRRQPWEARWWVNRRSRSKFFPTEKERDAFINDFQKEIGKHGQEVFKIDAHLQREWIEVSRILPDVSPVELVEHWLITKAAARASKGKFSPKAPPKNCLRHSFVSYHVALHRDPGKTALLISHKDQKILWDHYLGVATKEDGKRFFEISPNQ